MQSVPGCAFPSIRSDSRYRDDSAEHGSCFKSRKLTILELDGIRAYASMMKPSAGCRAVAGFRLSFGGGSYISIQLVFSRNCCWPITGGQRECYASEYSLGRRALCGFCKSALARWFLPSEHDKNILVVVRFADPSSFMQGLPASRYSGQGRKSICPARN
jgi:hypothetical protein